MLNSSATRNAMKTPKPRKLKSGTWFIQMRLNGVSVPVSAPTKQECIDAARLIKAEHKANKRQISPSNSTITLTQAIDGYIAAKSNSLSPSTVRGYRTIQKARFQKYMNSQIHNIRDWQAVYNSEIGRLSPKTLNNSFGFIQSVAKHYGVQMPNIDKKTAVRKERPFLDYSEILKFCDAIQGKEWEQDALFALHSLRVSEILGLRWEDVDLGKGIIHVRGAVVRDENNQRIRKETTKTAASRRDIPIFIPRLTEVLKARKKQKKPLLFYSSPDKLSTRIESTCKAAQITPVTVHGLRHSFASLCFHLHIPEETAMKLGGWSDFTTMRRIYTHIAEKDLSQHTADLTQFFQNANQNANGDSRPIENQRQDGNRV